MYSVVQWAIEATFAVVPTSWIARRNGKDGAFFPPSKIRQRTMKCEDPGKNWLHYEAKLYLGNIEYFKDAEQVARNLVAASDTESEMARIQEQRSFSGHRDVSLGIFAASGNTADAAKPVLTDISNQSPAISQPSDVTSRILGAFGFSEASPRDNEESTMSQMNQMNQSTSSISTNQLGMHSSFMDSLMTPPSSHETDITRQDPTFNHVQKEALNLDNLPHVHIEMPSFENPHKENNPRSLSNSTYENSAQRATSDTRPQTMYTSLISGQNKDPRSSSSTSCENSVQRASDTRPQIMYTSLISGKNKVTNEMIYRKLVGVEGEVKALQNVVNRLSGAVDTAEPDTASEVPRHMSTMASFTAFEDELKDPQFQRKVHKFLLPYARDGMCSRSIYAVLTHLGEGTLWREYSLRGQRGRKRRFDQTCLYSVMRKFCMAVGYRYKDMDDSISIFLKKFRKPKEQAQTVEGAEASQESAME